MKTETKRGRPVSTKKTPSWKPARLIEIPKKYQNPGFTYRWCSTEESRPGNITKKLQEGWIIDHDILPKMIEDGLVMPKTLQDGQAKDTTLRARELIVMKIPNEMAEARRAYYSERANRAIEENKSDLEKSAEKQQARIYGRIEIGQGG